MARDPDSKLKSTKADDDYGHIETTEDNCQSMAEKAVSQSKKGDSDD